MAEVKPFKGVIYNANKAGASYSSLCAPPYDVISPSMREEFYSISDYNVIRLILGKDREGDSESDNKYTRAKKYLDEWMAQGVMSKDQDEAFYAYIQEYDVEGQKHRRTGFLGLMKIEEPSEKKVLPHEKTHTKPKVDRLNLIKQVRGNLSPIFTLFSDKDGAVTKTIENYISGKPPLIEADYRDEKHLVWRVADADIISKIKDSMSHTKVFIADGHHRYEVARTYRDLARKSADYNGYADHVMTYFADMDSSDNLTVLATHRVIKHMPAMNDDEVSSRLSPYFETLKLDSLASLLDEMREEGDNHAFGFFGGGKYVLAKLKSGADVESLVKENKSRDWKNLDVSILHTAVFNDLVGIENAEGNVTYVRDAEEAESLVRDGSHKGAFFLNPTRVEQLKAVAENGEVMPQKSTYFFPKLLSGLVINKFD